MGDLDISFGAWHYGWGFGLTIQVWSKETDYDSLKDGLKNVLGFEVQIKFGEHHDYTLAKDWIKMSGE